MIQDVIHAIRHDRAHLPATLDVPTVRWFAALSFSVELSELEARFVIAWV
jgi:hypothetical protein